MEGSLNCYRTVTYRAVNNQPDDNVELTGAALSVDQLQTEIQRVRMRSRKWYPLLEVNCREVGDLISRWESAIPETVSLFQKHGTLELQAQYRLMLKMEQYIAAPSPGAETEAERAHLLML